MPMTGGSRMLRARRKDCNVKPNRRLDRKSSRGMLYENEELRLRTITINAEVEQGQHALKKLRRENEQLRREMWSLRDEYDKIEKMLKEKKIDDDSNPEKSDSEGNLSRADDSDEDDEKLTNDGSMRQLNENSQSEEENHLKPIPVSESNLRSFDGLSVIDEQTEETQTTESPHDCGSYIIRSNGETSQTPDSFVHEAYDDVCKLLDVSQEIARYSSPERSIQLKRKTPLDTGRFAGNWRNGMSHDYESRPASPYPCSGIALQQDSYLKKFQVLQKLSNSGTIASENSWIFPDSSKTIELSECSAYVEKPSTLDKEVNVAESPTHSSPSLPFTLIQDRKGPDVFITDGFPQTNDHAAASKTHECEDLESKLDGVQISRKTERHPKNWFTLGEGAEVENEGGNQTATLTKLPVSRDMVAETTLQNIPWDPQTLDPPKLTIDELPGGSDNNRFPTRVQQSVSCQNPLGQDVRGNSREEIAPETESQSLLTDEMPQIDVSGKTSAGGGVPKYQTKLMVTLKTPSPLKDGKRAFNNATGSGHSRSFQQPLSRFQTFPSSGEIQQAGHRTQKLDSRDCLVNHYAGIRTRANRLSESMSRLPIFSKAEIDLSASNIPGNYLEKESNVLPNEDSMPPPKTETHSLPKTVKIPPVPPPRTSSCSKRIIPGSMMEGNNVFDHGTHRQAKLLHFRESSESRPQNSFMYNPLLLSQPIATSSPTISPRMIKNKDNSSIENLYHCRFQNYYDKSSNEDLMVYKSKFKNCMTTGNAAGGRKLNKSLSSPSFDTFRTVRRKQSDGLAIGMENILSQGMLEKTDKKSFPKNQGQSNLSISSSSGFDSPVKNDRRKRRVSIQFKKMQQLQDEVKRKGGNEKESTCSRRSSIGQKFSSFGRGGRGIAGATGDGCKSKAKMDETEATTSERERTNSMSSRTSSFATGTGSPRKYSTSSNRTYLNDEKIPWCGCWGNGCI